ncbi:MAG: hypothetical protein JO143_14175 [Acetobacteraceae bacterium]|nr:hypothetical protein [Acetobacteraceae bacterium]
MQKRLSAAEDLAKNWHKLYRQRCDEAGNAKSASRKVEEAESGQPRPDSQFRRLRALILKELHSDHAPAGSVDRAIRAEIFKVMGPKIEAITSGV